MLFLDFVCFPFLNVMTLPHLDASRVHGSQQRTVIHVHVRARVSVEACNGYS